MPSITEEQKTETAQTLVKSPLKWAGGKSKLVATIMKQIPEGATFNRFVDVFSGSGVVAVNAPERMPSVLLNDFNGDLALLFSCLKSDPRRAILMAELGELFSGSYNTQEWFTAFRDEFNAKTIAKDQSERKAALFVYLNKHAFNGVCRYSAKGKFNVPYGRPKANPQLNLKEIENFSLRLGRAEITNDSFEQVLPKCSAGDCVYLDPPYSPVEGQTSNFTAYAGNAFGPAAQNELVRLAEEASHRGALVLISNHDTAGTRQLYRHADRLVELSVARSINSKGGERKKVAELIAVYLPKNPAPPLEAQRPPVQEIRQVVSEPAAPVAKAKRPGRAQAKAKTAGVELTAAETSEVVQ